MCPTTRWGSACLSAWRGPCAVLTGGRRGSSSAVTRSRPSCLREAWAVGAVGSTGRFWAMRVLSGEPCTRLLAL